MCIHSAAARICKLVKHRGVEGDFINITYMCNFTKERHASRQAKQKAGHVATVQAKQAVMDQANLLRSRVGKNALNTAVSSCGYLYRRQMGPQSILTHSRSG
jgi:hypothetical protein